MSRGNVNQAAREVNGISDLSKKDIIDSLEFCNKKILIIDTCNKVENDYYSNLEKLLKKNPYFCDINFTHFYGNNSFLISSLSIYGKRIYYKITSSRDPMENCNSISKYQRLCEIIQMNYKDYEGFIIIHNYETICYTASFLSFMLENLRKIVVLTGFQLPMELLKSDASSNLLNSLILAGHFSIPEVVVCFREKIFRGNRSQVVDSVGFDCVGSPNFPCLGTFGINISIKKNEILKFENNPQELNIFTNISDRCIVIKLNPFLTPELLQNIFNVSNIKGVILEAYGFGQISVKNQAIKKIIEENVKKKNLIILTVSQAYSYNLSISQYGKDNENLGIVNGGDMTLEAALAKMSYLIGKGYSSKEVKEKLTQNLKGEITSKSNGEVFSYQERNLLQAIDNPVENQELAESLHKLILPTIISHISKLGYLSLLKQISKTTNFNHPEINEGKSPLFAAVSQPNTELIKFLIEKCDVNAEDKQGRTPLFEAIRSRNKSAAKELVAAKAIIKAPIHEITHLLLNAAANNDLEMIKLFFHSGLDNLNQFTDLERRNIGHIAACENHIEIILFLWKVVCFDFSEKDQQGKTPLDDAKFFNHEEIIKILDPTK